MDLDEIGCNESDGLMLALKHAAMSCAPGEGGDEPRFRIRVCMSRYFADERARCMLLVPARRRVCWLARRLRALFPLPRRTALLCRGHLLPRDESLALLETDDLVEVVPRHAGRERGALAEESNDAETYVVEPRVNVTNEVKEARLDSDSGDCDSQAPDIPPAPSPAAEPDELRDSKRRALAALELYCGSITTTTVTPPPPPPRTRRRRARRRRRPAPWEPAEFELGAGAGEDGVGASGDAVRRDEAAGGGGGGGGTRAPRLVRALAAAPFSFKATDRICYDDKSVPFASSSSV